MKRLFTPFFINKRRQCVKGNTVTPAEADNQRVGQEPSEFHIVLGSEQKYLLEGRLLYPSDMVLKVDGQDARSRFNATTEAGLEIYEADLGETEKLAVRIERETNAVFKAKLRVVVNGRLAQVCNIRPQWQRRHLFFQAALPSFFLLLVGYYFLISGPEVVNFYSGMFSRPNIQMQQRPSKVRAMPAPATQTPIEDSAANVV